MKGAILCKKLNLSLLFSINPCYFMEALYKLYYEWEKT